jgi:hypothetical protein
MTEYECDICRDVYSTPTERRQHLYETHNKTSRYCCKICYRVVSDVAQDRWDAVQLHLERLLSPDRRTRETKGRLCGPCAEEFLELVDGMSSIDQPPELILNNKEWWEFTECNLCGNSLERTRGKVQYSWGGMEFDDWEFHVLCDGCVDVVLTFMENLPEGRREGDYFYGRKKVDVETSVEEANFEAIHETYREAEIGDEVHVEVHRPVTKDHPRDYTKFDGDVVDRRSLKNMTALCINPHSESGEYRVVGPSQYSDSIDAHHIAMDGNGKGEIGEVTVLERVSDSD